MKCISAMTTNGDAIPILCYASFSAYHFSFFSLVGLHGLSCIVIFYTVSGIARQEFRAWGLVGGFVVRG